MPFTGYHLHLGHVGWSTVAVWHEQSQLSVHLSQRLLEQQPILPKFIDPEAAKTDAASPKLAPVIADGSSANLAPSPEADSQAKTDPVAVEQSEVQVIQRETKSSVSIWSRLQSDSTFICCFISNRLHHLMLHSTYICRALGCIQKLLHAITEITIYDKYIHMRHCLKPSDDHDQVSMLLKQLRHMAVIPFLLCRSWLLLSDQAVSTMPTFAFPSRLHFPCELVSQHAIFKMPYSGTFETSPHAWKDVHHLIKRIVLFDWVNYNADYVIRSELNKKILEYEDESGILHHEVLKWLWVYEAELQTNKTVYRSDMIWPNKQHQDIYICIAIGRETTEKHCLLKNMTVIFT